MNIKELISKDLSIYTQDNPYPKSLTIVKGDSWRHYELGPIIGFVIWNEPKYNKREWVGIMEIHEDDMFWFVPEYPIYMAAAWIKDVSNTMQRMKNWYNEHIFEGYEDPKHRGESGYYVTKYLKEIKPEEIH